MVHPTPPVRGGKWTPQHEQTVNTEEKTSITVRKTVKKNVVQRAPRWRYDDRESTPEIRHAFFQDAMEEILSATYNGWREDNPELLNDDLDAPQWVVKMCQRAARQDALTIMRDQFGFIRAGGR